MPWDHQVLDALAVVAEGPATPLVGRPRVAVGVLQVVDYPHAVHEDRLVLLRLGGPGRQIDPLTGVRSGRPTLRVCTALLDHLMSLRRMASRP